MNPLIPRYARLLAAAALIPLGSACSGAGNYQPYIVRADYLQPVPSQAVLSEASSDLGMVVTGSPEATRAGVQILEQGGNAIDAAVAAALTLGVSDLDASGLGGMTYMLIRFADGHVTTIDGTPRAPMVVDRLALIELQRAGKVDGYPMAAVPTTLATLQTAVDTYGTMAMADLLQPALEIAETGYRLSPIQVIWTEVYFDRVTSNDYFRHLVGADGYSVDGPGTVRYRPDLANTLRRLAEEGVDSFYRGSIADDIEADMIANGGFIRKMDLAVTRVREVPPLRSTYRGREIFTFPSPGGGAAVIKTLDILETYPSSFLAEHSVERLQVMIEAARLGRTGHLESDPQEPDPFLTMEQRKELARRHAQLITPGRAIPKKALKPVMDPECQPKQGDSTTHLSVADRHGNVVSMTQTIGSSFGAKVATPGLGFPYNNFLLIFNYDKSHCPGFLLPRSEVTTDMAPTIVVEDGTVVAALGSPGSSRIPSLIATVVSNLVDAGMNLGEAMVAPRALYGGTSNPHPSIEILDPITNADADAIAAMGFESLERYDYPPKTRRIIVFGGVNALAYDTNDGTWVGVGDRHRWGSAMGPRAVAATSAPDEFGPR